MAKYKSSKLRASRRLQRQRRHLRVRKKVRGSADRPRLVVFRSLKNIEGQLIDDDRGETLMGISTLDPKVRTAEVKGANPKVERAHVAGKVLAERARAEGVETVVFDRGGYQYHGRVEAFATGAREGGLRF